MKKRFRTIKVNNIVYAWSVKGNVDGDGSNRVRVWQNRKNIIEGLVTGKITPSLIEGLIKKLCA